MKLLFIGIDYHEYTRSILEEFRTLGYESRFHNIQPGRLHFKIARRLSAAVYQTLLDEYHRQIILSVGAEEFDIVVFLQVHQMSPKNLELLKKRQSRARFVLYNWDAVSTHDYRPYMHFFDRVLTFDPRDAADLNISYLPLFATRRYQEHFAHRIEGPSAYFIGNIVNPQRYRVIDSFEGFCVRNSIKFDHFMSTTLHGYTEMLRAGIMPKEVSLRQIASERQNQMVRSAAAVFDFANHVQTGFTMRVMENLCAGKKIITNNKNIMNAPFYSPDRFHVFEGVNFSTIPDFLMSPLSDPENRFLEYSVQEFAATLTRETR